MSAYTRQNVEGLVGAVWDQAFAWGILNEQAPDPDMPRGTVDPSHGNTLYAMLADIRRAWKGAGLDPDERLAVELVGRFHCTTREAGKLVGVHQTTMLRRWEDGIGKLTFWLNGDTYEHDETETQTE